MTKRLLLNADLGEGMPGDKDIIPHVDMVNLAAGGHAGGGSILTETVSLAVSHSKRMGAHPSYPDIKNFGRISLWGQLTTEALSLALKEQILAVIRETQAVNQNISYIKPHGALYNDASSVPEIALLLGEIVAEVSSEVCLPGMPSLPLMLLANSPGAEALSIAGTEVLSEGFADRRYTVAGLLVPRENENAVLHDVEEICNQVENMWFQREVASAEGVTTSVDIDTVCVHGDTLEAVEITRALARLISSWEEK